MLLNLLVANRANSQNSFDSHSQNYWHLLLHYDRNLFGGSTSEAHNPAFFVAPNGRTNPEAELKVSLDAINENRLFHGQPFQCVFPARYRYLKTKFGLSQISTSCPDLDRWKSYFDAQSVSLVFATAYLGNVASMFGHTFLKINAKRGTKRKSELIDLGISYAADNDPNDNPISFAIKGLTGGYFEKQSIMAYFTRLAEYHNIENRDVWEFELNTEPAQIDQLLNHAWELRDAQMDYYFLHKNCTLHALELLQVAMQLTNPQWQITDAFVYKTVPTDGVQALANAGAISGVKFRPSVYHKLKQKVLAMKENETQAFERSKQAHLTLFGNESSLVLESLLDYQQFHIHPADRDLTESEQAKQNEILRALRKSEASSFELPPIAMSSQPDHGHASFKASLLTTNGLSDHVAGIEVRPALHDLLDNDAGYTPFSQVTAGTVRAGYSENRRSFDLQDVDLINIISLAPVDTVQSSASWLANLGAHAPPDRLCENCLAAVAQVGVGLSQYLMPKSENAIAFAFLKFNANKGAAVPKSFRWGPSELIGFDARLTPKTKWLNQIEFIQNFDQHFSTIAGPIFDYKSGLSWSLKKDFELRFLADYGVLSTSTNFLTATFAASFYL